MYSLINIVISGKYHKKHIKKIHFLNYYRGIAMQSLFILCGVVYGVIMIVKDYKIALFVYIIVLFTTFDMAGMIYILN